MSAQLADVAAMEQQAASAAPGRAPRPRSHAANRGSLERDLGPGGAHGRAFPDGGAARSLRARGDRPCGVQGRLLYLPARLGSRSGSAASSRLSSCSMPGRRPPSSGHASSKARRRPMQTRGNVRWPRVWSQKANHRYPDEGALGRMLDRASAAVSTAVVGPSVGEGYDVRIAGTRVRGGALVVGDHPVHLELFRVEG